MGEHPVLTALSALAAVVTILAFILNVLPFPPDPRPDPTENAVCADPSLSLSTGSGPSGTGVTVRGNGFPGDESVELRFHTEVLVPARTDGDGTFEVEVTVPGTFDAFAPTQFEITAVTQPTICTSSAPYRLTA